MLEVTANVGSISFQSKEVSGALKSAFVLVNIDL